MLGARVDDVVLCWVQGWGMLCCAGCKGGGCCVVLARVVDVV